MRSSSASSSPTRARSASSSSTTTTSCGSSASRARPIGVPDMLEIPAGKLDVEGEDPLEAARRELAEEIGKQAAHWDSLGAFYTSAGLRRRDHPPLPRHRHLRRRRAPRGRGERAHRHRDPPAVGPRRDPHRDQDSKTLIALYRLRDRLGADAVARRARPVAPKGVSARTPKGGSDGRRRRWNPRARIRGTVRAPRARLPRVPRVRARSLAQHARGVPLGPAAVRRVSERAATRSRSRTRTWPGSSRRWRPGTGTSRRSRRRRCSARSPACARSTGICAARGSSRTTRPRTCARPSRAGGCRTCSRATRWPSCSSSRAAPSRPRCATARCWS